MGIGNGQSKLLKILYEIEGFSDKTVLELGAQVPLVDEINDLFEFCKKNIIRGKYSAEDLYYALGFKQYSTIDINGEYNALKYDLNYDICEKYNFDRKFDVVTNFGTSEHVFNQFAVFNNIHKLCKIGGYMLHTLPTQGWGKHSFFKYDINFFEDLCSANNYELVYVKPFLRIKPYLNNLEKKIIDLENLIDFIKKNKDILLNEDPYYENNSINKLLLNISYGSSLFNVTTGCVIKKKNNNDFIAPIQGMYKL